MGNPSPSWNVLLTIAAAAATIAVSAFTVQEWRKRLLSRIVELENQLVAAHKERQAERMGRIRGQRELRQALLSSKDEKAGSASYPMTPIGLIRSCFSTRNGTPRQPMLVTLARASLVLSSKNVAAEALDGLSQYSHCWLIYVFHENTDLPGLWKQPPHKDFKAKVRVPRLDGGKMGVFATRTPHRPCPIGLTVAKIEGIQGATLLLSGADLVDGTPVLDIKPYLPYCDAVPDAIAPSWVKAGGDDDVIAMASVDFTEGFSQELAKCWDTMGKQSLYSSWMEFQGLLQQVLSRDIRSLSQRLKPRNAMLSALNEQYLNAPQDYSFDPLQNAVDNAESFDQTNALTGLDQSTSSLHGLDQSTSSIHGLDQSTSSIHFGELSAYDEKIERDDKVVYHLVLEGLDVSYTLLEDGKVLVEGAALTKALKPAASRDFDPRNWRHLFSNDA